MTLDQLRIFLAVAEREHVRRAAEALNLTQSATSAAVAALEERHGVRLFDRIGRRIVLTDAGRSFMAEARAVLERAAIAERALGDLAGLSRGHLTIAASQTVANYRLPAPLARFRAAHPGIAVSLVIGNTEEAAAAVRRLDADLAIVEGTVSDPALTTRAIGGDSMLLVAANGVAIDPADPAATGWVLREPGSGTRAILEAWIATIGLTLADLPIALELSSNEAVRAAVEAGAGASILSDYVVARSIEAGRLRAVALDLPRRSFTVLHHRERKPSRAEAAFLDHVDAEA